MCSSIHLFEISSEPKELHIIGASNGHGVTHTFSVNALNRRSIVGSGISTLRVVALRTLWLVVIIAKYASLETSSISLKRIQALLFSDLPTASWSPGSSVASKLHRWIHGKSASLAWYRCIQDTC